MQIHIDENTIEEMKKQLKKEGNIYRIAMMGFGWGGPSFEIVQGELSNEDEVYEQDGIKIAADGDMAFFFQNVRIKYIKTFFGGRFVLMSERGRDLSASDCWHN